MLKFYSTRATEPEQNEVDADERAAAEQREMLDIQKLIKMGFEEGDVIMAYYQDRFHKLLFRDQRKIQHSFRVNP